jgi:hypothetical protein
MPQIESWSRLPTAIRDHLIRRMHDPNIGVADLNRLRVWLDLKPTVPDAPWYKNFGSFQTLRRREASQDVPPRRPSCARAGTQAGRRWFKIVT